MDFTVRIIIIFYDFSRNSYQQGNFQIFQGFMMPNIGSQHQFYCGDR